MLYAALRSLCAALVRPLWYDEICTLVIVRLHSVPLMWTALKQNADGQPLLFYVLEWPAVAAVHNQQISFRLLSILGFSVTIVCLFTLVKKRSGSATALVCAAMPLITILYSMYAIEARPYALVFALFSMALLCYQRAPEAGAMVLLGVCLALAEALHYYAVLAFAPFILAELVFALKNARLRMSIWLAFACGFVPLAIFWPVLARFRSNFGPHYWAQPTLVTAEGSYSWFFNTTFSRFGDLLMAGFALAVLMTMLRDERRIGRGERPSGALLHEGVLALGFLGLPFVCFFVAQVAHGGMTERYMLPAMLGFPLAFAYAVPHIRQRRMVLAAAAVCIVAALVVQEGRFWFSYNGRFPSPAQSVEDLVGSAGHADLPVVVSEPNQFLQLAYYSSPEWTKRFVSLIDVAQVVEFTHSDSIDKQFEVMRHYAPLPIYDFQPFVTEHPVFLLYSGYAGMDYDWWPRKLRRDGYILRELATDGASRTIFLVSRDSNLK